MTLTDIVLVRYFFNFAVTDSDQKGAVALAKIFSRATALSLLIFYGFLKI